MKNKILRVKAGWLVASAGQIYKDSGIRILDGKVIDIVPNERKYTDEEIVDYSDKIVCPAFSDMHSHLYSVLLRNVSMPPVSLMKNLETFWWPELENRQTIETIQSAVSYGVYRHLVTGYTFVNDILEAPFATYGERLTTEEMIMRKAGMKGILALEACERISGQNGLEALQESVKFAKTHKENRDIRGAICTHTAFSSGEDFLLQASELAKENQYLLQFHMNEGSEESEYCREKYGMDTTEYYSKIGFWSKGMHIFANQCSSLSERDMQIMREYGVGVASQPESNALEGSGIADVDGMIQNGICVSLGSDAGEGNPFELMRMLYVMQRGLNGFTDRICEENVFKISTENGPKSVGFQNIGALRQGYDADFIVLQNDTPIDLCEETVLSEIIWNMNPDHICAVYSDGICRLKNGHPIGFDEEQVISNFNMTYKSFWKKYETKCWKKEEFI